MFEKEIEEYERIRKEYQQKVVDRMGREQWMEYNEILFSAHSCAIEGNSFTVDDTRILHPFRDGNGRTGRLLSNFILLRAGHPLLIIKLEDRAAYISALKQIRTEGTDEHLVTFFFKTAIERMKSEMKQKKKNSLPMMFF